MSFVHDGDGSINVAAHEVDIEVNGDRSVGIGAGQRYEGTGDITIDVRDAAVAVAGKSVAGIRSFHMSGGGHPSAGRSVRLMGEPWVGEAGISAYS